MIFTLFAMPVIAFMYIKYNIPENISFEESLEFLSNDFTYKVYIVIAYVSTHSVQLVHCFYLLNPKLFLQLFTIIICKSRYMCNNNEQNFFSNLNNYFNDVNATYQCNEYFIPFSNTDVLKIN